MTTPLTDQEKAYLRELTTALEPLVASIREAALSGTTDDPDRYFERIHTDLARVASWAWVHAREGGQ